MGMFANLGAWYVNLLIYRSLNEEFYKRLFSLIYKIDYQFHFDTFIEHDDEIVPRHGCIIA